MLSELKMIIIYEEMKKKNNSEYSINYNIACLFLIKNKKEIDYLERVDYFYKNDNFLKNKDKINNNN